MNKKSIEHKSFKFEKTEEKKCDEKQCNKLGEYIAPKSPKNSEKYLFCIDHIKIYNKRWNFFAGRSQQEIYDYQKNDFFENRPAKSFTKGENAKIKFEFDYFLDKSKVKFSKKTKKFEKNLKNSFNIDTKKSLDIFGLKSDVSEDLVKKKYKELVKKYHPDLNKNYSNKERKIKEINKAYKILVKFAKVNHGNK